MLAPWKKSYHQPRQRITKQRHYFANKGLSHQSYGYSSSHVWMWELVYKESWARKNWCFWIVMLEKTLVVPWTASISNQSILKEINPECSLEGLMKLKLQYFGYLLWKTESLEKILMLGKIEGRRRGWQRMRWHHQLNGHELKQAPGVGDEQGSPACCNLQGHKKSDTTERLNWTDLCLQVAKTNFLNKGELYWLIELDYGKRRGQLTFERTKIRTSVTIMIFFSTCGSFIFSSSKQKEHTFLLFLAHFLLAAHLKRNEHFSGSYN